MFIASGGLWDLVACCGLLRFCFDLGWVCMVGLIG